MKCPNCRLINPNTALRCDCGYDFESGTIKESYLQTSPSNLGGQKAITIVALVCALTGSGALLFVFCACVLNVIPLGFEGRGVFGGSALWLGGISTIIGEIIFVVIYRRDKKRRVSILLGSAYCLALFAGYITVFWIAK
jgi:hypothetical protein